MNKKLIAMAIAAGLTLPVAAIAGPSVGGHMQIELNSPDVKDNASTNADELNLKDNARGRLWIKGDEDLGGNMKAIYKAEWRVNTDLGGAAADNRESYVGLKGNFGTVYAGSLASPYKSNAGTDYDPYTASVLESRGNGGALKNEGTMTSDYGQNGFVDNAIAYKKKFGAVSVHLQYHLSESVVQDSTFAAAVRFKAGAGIEVIAATISQDASVAAKALTNPSPGDVGNAAVTAATLGGTRSKLGVTWKGGPHKVIARYETQSDDIASNDVTGIFTAYHLTMGKNVLTVQYGQLDGDAAGDDKTYTMLAVKHNLSKKTAAWVGFRDTDFDTANNNDNSVISAGLRIKF